MFPLDPALTRVSRLASAFTKLVTSFVSDIILPVISLLPFLSRNMDEKFAVLKPGPHYSKAHRYNTLKQAQDDGALVMAYGCVLPRLRLLHAPKPWSGSESPS